MSATGQSRRFSDVRVTSAHPPNVFSNSGFRCRALRDHHCRAHCSVLGLDLKSSDHDVVIAQVGPSCYRARRSWSGAAAPAPAHYAHARRPRRRRRRIEQVAVRQVVGRVGADGSIRTITILRRQGRRHRDPDRLQFTDAPSDAREQIRPGSHGGSVLFIQLVVPQLSVSASELRGVVSLAHDLSPSNQRGSSNRWWGHTGSTLCGAVYFNVLEDFSLSGSF